MTIPRGYFSFLEGLAAHNERPWFKAHEETFRKDVEGPFLDLVAAIAPGFSRACPRLRVDASRTRGSTLRIQRDVRFSRDQTPYKLHMTALFLHEDRPKGAGMLGMFLRLGVDEMLLGAGLHLPDAPTLRRVREAIAADTRTWRRVGAGVEGASLKRVPAPFPPDHPCADDLRRKEFYRTLPFTRREVLDPDFPRTVVATARKLEPFLGFLARGAGLRW
jgi:uncharacterized protein (TIGR02453 family)